MKITTETVQDAGLQVGDCFSWRSGTGKNLRMVVESTLGLDRKYLSIDLIDGSVASEFETLNGLNEFYNDPDTRKFREMKLI
ncbi:hypothetical protein [Rummeliibacillus stabekisii]|uniref:hypothetical protein n=1 Tax=Rummeliibacillus stabekisii TaxID=241244 RepID=UPI003723B841